MCSVCGSKRTHALLLPQYSSCGIFWCNLKARPTVSKKEKGGSPHPIRGEYTNTGVRVSEVDWKNGKPETTGFVMRHVILKKLDDVVFQFSLAVGGKSDEISLFLSSRSRTRYFFLGNQLLFSIFRSPSFDYYEVKAPMNTLRRPLDIIIYYNPHSNLIALFQRRICG